MRIALAGNPNSGKTTMYNALTGANEKVGNWAGVTVEKKSCCGGSARCVFHVAVYIGRKRDQYIRKE